MPTLRQIRAAKALVDSSSIAQGLVKAGFSKKTARHPSTVTRSKGFIEASKPIIAQLENQRQLAIRRMIRTIDKASYADATRTVATFTDKIELLSGRPTEHNYNHYDSQSTDDLIAKLATLRGAKN